MPYQVEIKGMDEALKTFGNAPHIFQAELRTAMGQSVVGVATAAKKAAPVGVSGEMRASITSQVKMMTPPNVEGVVGSPLPYALYMEEGTRPHYPPIGALLLWVQRVINPGNDRQIYAVAKGVQRAIGRRGTRARKFLAGAFDDNQNKIVGYFDKALDRIAQRLAKE